MTFVFKETPIKDVLLVESKIYQDDRGYFLETYKKSEFENYIASEFKQDNYSFSRKGVIRGLHFQIGDTAQGKLVRVLNGGILDVAVDLRPESPSFRKHVAVILSSENHNALWIPPGFAHGFQALEDSLVQYKVTTEYAPGSEGGIIWNDPDLAIDWPIKDPILSEKDTKWPTMKEIISGTV